jgi:hypothetical protein
MKRLLSIVVMIVALAVHSIVSAASDGGSALDACRKVSVHELLVTLQVDRTSGSPNRKKIGFSSASSRGLLCIENHGASSGGVSVNGSAVVVPGDFAGAPALIGRFVTLQQANALIATVSGLPGQGFTVDIYRADPAAAV